MGGLTEKLRTAEARLAEGQQSQSAHAQKLTQQLEDARGEFAQLQVSFHAWSSIPSPVSIKI